MLGSNTFIPGFEEQLVGVAAGERRASQATFPEAYAVRALAGQNADFDVTVKAVAAPSAFAIDDEFAKSLGFESLDKLKEMIRDRIAAEYARASREKVKRQLLDALDARYSFELPEGLVDQEFDSIWTQVEREQQASGRSFADENTTEEAARADYRKIAERRVRLGLLLAEVGSKADVKIARRGNDPGADRARPLLSRPGKAGLGLLPQQPAGARRIARADLRGEGRRPHPRRWPRSRSARSPRKSSCKPTTTSCPAQPASEDAASGQASPSGEAPCGCRSVRRRRRRARRTGARLFSNGGGRLCCS